MNFAPSPMTQWKTFMRSSFKHFWAFWGLCLTMGLVLQLNAQTKPDFIIRKGAEATVYPIAVTANNSRDLALLQRAFSVHGAFSLVPPEQSSFRLDFQRVDDHSVELIISQGDDGQVLRRIQVSGTESLDALWRAADRAVYSVSGQPGFFAGKLAFIGETGGGKPEVYTSDLFFNSIKKLTADNSLAVSPSWSPDGQQILYTTYFQTGFPDIYRIDLGSMSRSGFATFKGTNSSARFSPNGGGVAMVLSSPGNPEVYVADSMGRQFTRLTNNDSLEASPSWKADGTELVFTSDAIGRPQLYRMSSRGGKMTRIKTNISGYCAEPDWNPRDADKIVFTAVFSNGFQVVLWEFSKNKCTILTRGNRDSIEPTWLNDGRHIVFTRRNGARKQLMILDTVSKRESPLHDVRFGNTSQADYVYLR